MAIYIPTYHRVGGTGSIDFIPEEYRDRTFLVCPPEEVEAYEILGYQTLATDTHGHDPENPLSRGIAPTRQWIIDNHDVTRFGEGLLMIDDDLHFSRRREDDPSKFRMFDESGDDMRELLHGVEYALDYSPLVGVSNRLFANFHSGFYRVNYRNCAVWGVNVSIVREESVRADRVASMEDFDFQLQLLTRGFTTLGLNNFVFGERNGGAGKSTGGCAEAGRTEDSHSQSARRMSEIWPGLVTAVSKKSWDGEGERLDARVSWKKAAKQGRETVDLIGMDRPELIVVSEETGELAFSDM